ncbi:TPA: hypothetical protein O8U24_004494 [Enterobacter kobei]|nr:hypothetical protein [Enterobacter kobei]
MEFTKERLRACAREKVKSLEFSITQTAFADSRAELEEELELARIALASLEADAVYFVEIEDGQDINAGRIEGKNRPDLSLLPDGINHLYTATPAPANAEPVAWLWSHRKHPSEVTLVRPEDDERAEGAHWSGWSCQALYAEPQAPVSVPDEVNVLLNHLEDVLPDEAFNLIDVKTWNNVSMLSRPDVYRAAMLQGADGNSPVIPDGSEDTKRLDWLDAQNKRLNEYYGTTYGWKFDANFQRNAMMLNDSNYPVMTVRQAIDEAIAAAPQQEGKP